MGMIEVLSPEGGGRVAPRPLAGGVATLDGVLVALHDNSKPGASALLEGIAQVLASRGASVRRWSKPHAARPSHLLAEVIGACRAAVFALGD